LAAKKLVVIENPRAATDIDAYVGARIRARRQELGVSQEKLADEVGVTFQQIQKYEKGVNRVAAATLYRIVKILDAPMTSFFPGAATPLGLGDVSLADPVTEDSIAKQASRLNPKGRALLAAFAQTLLSYDNLIRKR